MQDWNELMKGKTFITDVGSEQTSLVGKEETVIGRYAVWSPLSNSNSHQVIEVGNDLNSLQNKYGIPDDRVCRLTA